MMPQDTFLIPVPPQHLHTLRPWDVTPAHLAYRIGEGGRLLRVGGTAIPRGGVMYLDHRGFNGMASPERLFRELLQEFRAGERSGIILDFDRPLPPLQRLTALLNDRFQNTNQNLYVTERYAGFAPCARVMIPSALSGGSLLQRLSDACSQFGAGRVAVALDMVAEDFCLPSPSGSGSPLSRDALAQRIDQLHPSIFFSPELCARYFTYMARDGSAHFVLFDDNDTLQRKAEIARQVGIHAFLLPWPLLERAAPQLGLARLPTRTQNKRS